MLENCTRIDYQKNKFTNVLALVAQHITLLPIITTCLAYKAKAKANGNEEALLFIGQAFNTLGLTVGLYVGLAFAGKHLMSIGRPNIALCLTVFMPGTFVLISYLIQVAVGIFYVNEGQDKRDNFSLAKDAAIGGNPATWLLVPVTLAVDKGINSVINCCNKSTEMTTES
ncbi:MAG: hypothetical protein HRK26_03825 [Rickettsiaceae bacterium H1]|nr:hypothetical protein [Rickettsiaceae bacterium H1]